MAAFGTALPPAPAFGSSQQPTFSWQAPAPPVSPMSLSPAPATPATAPGYGKNASGVMAGLSAASQVAPGNDAESAATAAGVSALAAGGAAFVGSGFNPFVGLAVGSGAALTSLVNSYFTTRAQRKRDRRERRLLTQAEAKQAERDRIARSDAIEQQGYDRNQDKMRTAWAQQVEMMKRITDTINQNQSLKDRWVGKGYV